MNELQNKLKENEKKICYMIMPGELEKEEEEAINNFNKFINEQKKITILFNKEDKFIINFSELYDCSYNNNNNNGNMTYLNKILLAADIFKKLGPEYILFQYAIYYILYRNHGLCINNSNRNGHENCVYRNFNFIHNKILMKSLDNSFLEDLMELKIKNKEDNPITESNIKLNDLLTSLKNEKGEKIEILKKLEPINKNGIDITLNGSGIQIKQN